MMRAARIMFYLRAVLFRSENTATVCGIIGTPLENAAAVRGALAQQNKN
jgi:hypothetical protein